ncbi:MAG: hypothetical protein J6K17_13560 [Oscillospiraceae bacterium]|nr:hypothetical protein [Oscillospiraceae bacterium]
MNKQLIPLFVMSIFSIVLSVVSLGFGIWAFALGEEASELMDSNDAIAMIFGLFGSVMVLLLAVLALIAFSATLLPGIFGIISSIKNGRFSLACVIIGSIETVFALIGIPTMLEDIMNDFNPIGLIPFIYCGIYTSCAIIAFMYRKRVIHEQITEKPYESPTTMEDNKL